MLIGYGTSSIGTQAVPHPQNIAVLCEVFCGTNSSSMSIISYPRSLALVLDYTQTLMHRRNLTVDERQAELGRFPRAIGGGGSEKNHLSPYPMITKALSFFPAR